MGQKEVDKKVLMYICERCGYEWESRLVNIKPITCPRCKSPYWNKKRKNGRNKSNKNVV